MKNQDQPAYPHEAKKWSPDSAQYERMDGYIYPGLSKRELLAAMAMQSILESFGRGLPGPAGIVSNARGEPTTAGELYSEAAIGYADALLAELDKDNVCEWVWHRDSNTHFTTGCGKHIAGLEAFPFCPYCGRKIKEVK